MDSLENLIKPHNTLKMEFYFAVDLKLLTYLLLLSALSITVKSDCRQGIVQCMEPIMNYTRSMQEGRFVPYLTKEEFKTFCRKYKGFHDCLEALDQCHSVFEKTIEGIGEAMEFICQEDPEGYFEYSNCVAHPVVHVEMKTCEQILQQSTTPPKDSVPCSELNEYLACGYKALEDRCSSDQAEFFEKVLVKAIEPVAQSYDCDLEPQSKKANTGLIVGVVVAVLLLIVLIAAAVVFYVQKRKTVRKGYSKPGTSLVA